jgi:hypothetical protein
MARGQRCCLISPAGEGVDDAEGGGDARCAVDKLPRPTEVEAPLEIRACALEISATQVDKSESKPPEAYFPHVAHPIWCEFLLTAAA